jgi:hypothetical protein
MQGWIRSQPAERVGPALHDRFMEAYERGSLITPEESANSLLGRLPSDVTGMTWDVRDS